MKADLLAARPSEAAIAASSAPAARRAARASQVSGPTTAHLLILLAWTWCLAMCAHVPKETATTALAAAYGLLFLLLLPFHRWACFLVVVSACGAEVALRAWSPIRYNTLHYVTLVLLPIS